MGNSSSQGSQRQYSSARAAKLPSPLEPRPADAEADIVKLEANDKSGGAVCWCHRGDTIVHSYSANFSIPPQYGTHTTYDWVLEDERRLDPDTEVLEGVKRRFGSQSDSQQCGSDTTVSDTWAAKGLGAVVVLGYKKGGVPPEPGPPPGKGQVDMTRRDEKPVPSISVVVRAVE